MTYAPALSRPLWRGRTNVDAMTIAAIEAAETLAGFTFTVSQGSYQGGHGDLNSAGTHDGGGVVDFSVRDLTDQAIATMVRALRRVGFFASDRPPSEGPWVRHVHAVLGGHPLLAPAAARQWDSYLHDRNGLVNNGPDRGPRITPIPRFTYPPKEDDMTPTQLLEVLNSAAGQEAIRKAVAPEIRRVAGDVVETPGGGKPIMLKTAVARILKAVTVDPGK